MMKSTIYISLIALLLVSCSDKKSLNYQYFPNMYESVGYETYQPSTLYKNGQASREPVAGTVKRGWMPYAYSNDEQGYLQAKAEFKNPLNEMPKELSANQEKGKELFDIYCAICHGKKGDGQGELVKREKFLGIPNYKDRDITAGSIYHVIYYGRNSMGSHAGQLNEKERWQVTLYVENLRNDLIK